MSFRDFTKTRRVITAFDSDALFTKLISETCKRIDTLKIFYSVGPQVREQPSIKCPSCIVIPGRVEIAEHQLSGARFDYRFYVNIGFALKHPNDTVIMQQALYLEEKIRHIMSKGDSSPTLTFSSISEHYNTSIEFSAIEPVELLANKVLAFSSGINVVYWVWQSI